jgi:hypothetical protein
MFQWDLLCGDVRRIMGWLRQTPVAWAETVAGIRVTAEFIGLSLRSG